ncbi:LOW QUALITY PROTEIN: hypothetical protein KUTeg_024782, partial [Tegillarca granosa]
MDVTSVDTYRTVLRESINGYVFWSLFQGLGPMIWFYPLNELEISGYEAYAALWFTPIILGIPGMLSLVQNKWILGFLRLIMVASIGSFQAGSTLSRLIILAVGNGVAMLVFIATLWNPNAKIRTCTFWGLLLGWMSLVVSRIWFVSFLPTWWSNSSNSVVIAIATIAVIDQIISGADNPISKLEMPKVNQPYWIPTSIGFGSLLYLSHWCFGERWTVKGYPDTGPSPYPWGALVLLCLAMGVYMSACRHMANSKVWWLFGVASFIALYYLPTWSGYTGGLMLAIYTMSIWPEMTDRLTLCPPVRSIVLVLITYLVEIFFFVWTVAYNFVPGGVYTREHTDFLIAAVMIGIFMGLFLVLVVLCCIGLTGFAVRYDPDRYNHPSKKESREFSSAIWTYHFGYDNRGWPSLERSKTLLNDTGADVITLLESDASKPFLGNNDLGMWLGEKLGMYVDFGPATKDHTWGNLILSKYPIVKSTHHLLPSPHGELAPGITCYYKLHWSSDFVVTHMGNDRDVLDRKLQAEFLSNELKNSKNPVVFMGYVTSAPGSRDYNQLISNGNVKDIDKTDRDRWCEYIMYRGLKRLGYARITHGGLSDTEVQLAKFSIPENPDNFKDNNRIVTDPKPVDKKLHFNSRFGSYHDGHDFTLN